VKGKQHLKKKYQFDLVYEKGRTWSNRQLVFKAVPNQMAFSRYGFSVSRKVGGAVKRNLVKRRLREIVGKQVLVPGWDLLFIARSSAREADFRGLQASVTNVLLRAGILANKHETACPETN